MISRLAENGHSNDSLKRWSNAKICMYCLLSSIHLLPPLRSQIKKPSLSTSSPVPPTKQQLYWQAPAQLEEETRPNLEKRLVDLVQDGGEITVTSTSLPFSLSLRVKYV
ncbi:E2 binding protein [Ramaria rubella]|nr:E2 binding protein [Ramaria rubella]